MGRVSGGAAGNPPPNLTQHFHCNPQVLIFETIFTACDSVNKHR